jgi:acetate kinase
MAILILNCGSSSVKYRLYRIKLEEVLAQGLVAAIGSSQSSLTHQQINRDKITLKLPIPHHAAAIDLILKKLADPHDGILKDIKEIELVGHRVVHGGDKFSGSVIINDETKEGIRHCFDLAPLHNPHNMEGIRSCEKLLPGTMQVAVFDTAFHQTMPPHAFTYGIPHAIAEKYHIRKYGFHGTSHKYVSQKAAELLPMPYEQLKVITCHLGNGCSITAIDGGKSADTSMGFTPLEGLLMGTRCGDIDPAVPLFLAHAENLKPEQVDRLLNDKSGLLGVSGISNDMRILQKEASQGSQKAQLAIQLFCYRVKKYIASYIGILNGAHAIVFTAGIGENSPDIRRKCCENLDCFGIAIDDAANNTIMGSAGLISASNSKIKVFTIPTNEELLIAQEAKLLLDKKSHNKL